MKIRLLKNCVFDNICYGAERVMEVEKTRYVEDLIRSGKAVATTERVTEKKKVSGLGGGIQTGIRDR